MPCSGWRGMQPPPGARERATQPPELLEVGLGECLEALAPGRGELQADDPVVLGVAHPLDQLGRVGPVHQPDGAVVAEQEVVGHLADGRAAAVGVPADGQQQLVLRRRQSGGLRLLLAPAEEPAQSGPQRQQILVVGIPQTHRLTIASCHDSLGDGGRCRWWTLPVAASSPDELCDALRPDIGLNRRFFGERPPHPLGPRRCVTAPVVTPPVNTSSLSTRSTNAPRIATGPRQGQT